MTLREWLLLIGALVIVVIVLDGVRRMYRARRDAAEISRGMGGDVDMDDVLRSELPNGGARIVERDADLPAPARTAPARAFKPTRPVVAAGARPEPEMPMAADPHDRWEEAVPVVEHTPEPSRPTAPARPAEPPRAAEPAPRQVPPVPVETRQAAEDDYDDYDLDDAYDEMPVEPAPVPVEKPRPTPAADVYSASPRPIRRQELPHASRPEPTVAHKESRSEGWNPARLFGFGKRVEAPEPAEPVIEVPPLPGANRPPAQEVIVINVLARSGSPFPGGPLRDLLEACGLEHGDLGIYHRHEEVDTRSPVQFSVASAVQPGAMNPDTLPGSFLPGLSFFMSLPGPSDSLKAFEFMLETAQCVVRNLQGELKDERMSVMTGQTIEHCRQRIREFERKRRSVKV